MQRAATSEPATVSPRPLPILAYAKSDDESPTEFEIEWSGFLERWIVVHAYTDALIDLHQRSAIADASRRS